MQLVKTVTAETLWLKHETLSAITSVHAWR